MPYDARALFCGSLISSRFSGVYTIGFAGCRAAAVAITALLPVCICLRFPVVFPEADVHLLLLLRLSLFDSRLGSSARLVPLL